MWKKIRLFMSVSACVHRRAFTCHSGRYFHQSSFIFQYVKSERMPHLPSSNNFLASKAVHLPDHFDASGCFPLFDSNQFDHEHNEQFHSYLFNIFKCSSEQ